MPRFFLNDYTEEAHAYAQNHQNIYVSHTSDSESKMFSHMHASCELLFFEKGGGKYYVEDHCYEVGERSVLIIGAAQLHGRIFTELPCVRYGLNVIPGYLQNLPIINTYINLFQTLPPRDEEKLKNIDPDIFGRMITILKLLRRETEADASGEGYMSYALLLELTILLQRVLQAEKIELSASYRAMAEVKKYIDFHYMEDLSLESLSRQFCLRPYAISKRFSQSFGTGINDYINSVRISNAIRLLEDSRVNITDLALLVGYGNVNSFLRQFRKRVRTSPLQYRKSYEQYRQSPSRELLD